MAYITKTSFGQTKQGEQVDMYTLKNKLNTQVEIITYGAAVRSFRLNGDLDVVLGYDTIEDYEKQDKYMGAIVGRVANRIGGGKFSLNGRKYTLCCNNGANHLHGGNKGFDKQIWSAEKESGELWMSYFSADGEEGYPGNLQTLVKYSLSDENEFTVTYSAKGDEDTLVNLSSHCYFNLSGHNGGDIYSHNMQIFASKYNENDENCLPTGVISDVNQTPMDFTVPKKIGKDIDENYIQLKNVCGYDHNWILNKNGNDFSLCAKVTEDKTKVGMEVYTTQAGVQFYSGNFLDGKVRGKKGAAYNKRSGFCLETQAFPNATAFEYFPSIVLKKGDVYNQKTMFKFFSL
ncbi:MAG: aldose epimerase family protein [Lachnospiraceae bacterium]|nr:aldose epimerase family protein [Lachnospiraceae bacterium]